MEFFAGFVVGIIVAIAFIKVIKRVEEDDK